MKIVAQQYWYRRQTKFVQAMSVIWKVLPNNAKRLVCICSLRLVEIIMWRRAQMSNRTLLPAFVDKHSHKKNIKKYNGVFAPIGFI